MSDDFGFGAGLIPMKLNERNDIGAHGQKITKHVVVSIYLPMALKIGEIGGCNKGLIGFAHEMPQLMENDVADNESGVTRRLHDRSEGAKWSSGGLESDPFPQNDERFAMRRVWKHVVDFQCGDPIPAGGQNSDITRCSRVVATDVNNRGRSGLTQ